MSGPNAPSDKIFTITITQDDGSVEVTTKTVGPGDFASVTNNAASLESDFTRSTAGTLQPTNSRASTASVTQTESASTPSTLITSATATGGTQQQNTASAAPETTATGVSSGSNSENPSRTDGSCDSISCNAGLQAAIAVPVVVVSLLLLALLFCCLRRRKRRQASVASMSEKRQKKPKKWSRHLRIFSFDAELLMGGRFSSSNSLRSRETGSQRSGARSAHNASPSIHSVDEEVAPPYRDAVTHTQPPSTVPMAPGLTSTTADPFPRPDSVATAPPPYPAASGAAAAGGAAGAAAAASGLSRATSRASTTLQTPVSTRSLNDPFRNDVMSPVSPVEGGHDASPFIDPPEEARSPISPSQSLRRPGTRTGEEFDDAQSTISSVAEVASVREAQVGRTLSTKQGRRV